MPIRCPPGSTLSACFKNSTHPFALPLFPLRILAHNNLLPSAKNAING